MPPRMPEAVAGPLASRRGSVDHEGMREQRAPHRRIRVSRAAVAALLLAATTVTLTGCGGTPAKATADDSEGKGEGASQKSDGRTAARPGDRKADPTRIPGVGDALQRRIPAKTRQVVAVHGAHKDSAVSTLQLFTRQGKQWKGERTWPAHNGRKGWTLDHHEDDKRSPVGVFSLTDAGGVRPAPDAKLPYTQSPDFTPPAYWPKKTRNDFDHVIAVDYNRTKGTSPLDPARPEGQEKGGGIWLHLDHGDGTSGCVSVSRSGMRYLLRTLDPGKHPVVVMGDKASLARD